MKYYATLNENNICVSVSSLAGPIRIDEKTIEIETYSENYVFKKYEGGQWSEEKFEPTPVAPVVEPTNSEIQKSILVLMDAVATLYEDLVLGGA